MDGPLSSLLESSGLAEFGGILVELGVKTAGDIKLLSDDDLRTHAGLNIVQIRRLKAAAKEECSDDDEDGDGTSPMCDGTSPGGDGQSPVMHSVSSVSDAHYERSEDGKYLKVSLDRAQSRAKRRSSAFWQHQLQGRPTRLIFVRHGESEANVNRAITATVPDHLLHLTMKGREQALDAGVRLRGVVGDETVKFMHSPYVRTRETLNGILHAWSDKNPTPPSRSDVRLREQEYGNYDSPNMKEMHKEKKNFGPFYYRFANGESPADCFDRASSFLESMYRQWTDNTFANHVIVGHGLMNLVLLMRLTRLPVDEFESLAALKNCEFVVLERPEDDAKFSIVYTWAGGEEKDYHGLRRQETGTIPDVWDGRPDAPPLVSASQAPGSAGYPAAADRKAAAPQ